MEETMPAPHPTTTNARHLSISVEHYTPAWIVEAAREVLGGAIDLDPASCELANRTVRAVRIFTRQDDGLERDWNAERVFLNPPGGKEGNESIQKAWWWKLSQAWSRGTVEHAVFVCFSIELLQTTQFEREPYPLPLQFPICFPSRRIPYDRASEAEVGVQAGFFDAAAPATTVEAGKQPPHASCVVYLPPRWRTTSAIALFERRFSPIGHVINTGGVGPLR